MFFRKLRIDLKSVAKPELISSLGQHFSSRIYVANKNGKSILIKFSSLGQDLFELGE